MKKNYKEIVMIAGVFMALNIGAGFASGQEIFQFFSGYGWLGFLGCLIIFVIITYGAESIIDAGWLSKEDEHISVFEYFCGQTIGKIYNIIVAMVLYGSFIIMVSGAGAVLQEFFLLPSFIGRAAITILSVMSIFLDFRHITKIISKFSKIVTGIIILISCISIGMHWSELFHLHKILTSVSFIRAGDTFYGAGILYASSIVLLSSQFLFELGKTIEDRSSGVYGAFYGTMGFVLAAVIINLAILANFKNVYNLKIITIYFASQISSILGFIMSLLLAIVMYSASTTTLWGVGSIIRRRFRFWKHRYKIVIILLGTCGYLISGVPFDKLVNILYPLNGIFGGCLILFITVKHRWLSYHRHPDIILEKEGDASIDHK